jgi:ankyrin repeat protein
MMTLVLCDLLSVPSHPAFFGHAEDVIKDCCGFCPKPVTPEEHDIAEEEAKIYVSGEISFIKDDAGRQAIGSFHPITDDDWTEMAYIGNTTRLCQAIIDEDLEHVEDWLKQEGSDPNCRDHTGPTPLHLAVTSSSAEVVEALIDHGARLVARLADGRTALHLASARGNVEMVRMIMQRSVENEAEEDKKEDIRKKARAAAREEKRETADVREGKPQFDTEDSDIEMVDKEDSDDDMQSTTTGSYMKVKEPEAKENQNLPEDDGDEPDVYDVNVLTWDSKCSPLHYAILNGHIDVVKTLVQDHGADPLLPIKLLSSHDKSPRGAILTLVLALQLPLEKAKAMTQALLEIGASSAQANTSQTTALHFISGEQPEVIETLFQFDEPAAKRAINHLAVSGSSWSPSAESPLMSAISSRNSMAALKLLEAGANPAINFKAWLKSVETQFEDVAQRDSKQNHDQFVKDVEQPIVLAIQTELPDIALQLLAKGADPNTLPKGTQQGVLEDWYRRYNKMESLLEMVQAKLQILRNYKDDQPPTMPKLQLIENKDYLDGLPPGSYKHFVAEIQLEKARASDKYTNESYEVNLKTYNERVGIMEKKQAVEALTKRFEEVEKELIARGAKTFKELYPNLVEEKRNEETPHHYANFPELPWEVTYDFRVHDLVDDTRQAYLQLFQAAWDGDLDTIKSLTLAAWGPENDKTPLKVAITDGIDESPFTLAVLRGHFEIARGIVETAYTQYDPNEMKEKEKARYRLGNVRDEQSNDDEDEDEDEASDASDSSAVPVRKEMVDELFTINIGEVTTSAKSKISPLTFLEWSSSSLWNYVKFCGDDKKFTYGLDTQEVGQRGYGISLLSWAIITNYMPLFSLMLDLQVEWIDRLAKDAKSKEIPAGFPTFSQNEFGLAIQYGRLDMLAEMIKHGGAGLELESLVKKSGVKYQEKTEFYQGLSVSIYVLSCL